MSRELVTVTFEVDFDACLQYVNQYCEEGDEREGWTDEQRKKIIAAVLRDGMNQSWEHIYKNDLEQDDPDQTGFTRWFMENEAKFKTFSITEPANISV